MRVIVALLLGAAGQLLVPVQAWAGLRNKRIALAVAAFLATHYWPALARAQVFEGIDLATGSNGSNNTIGVSADGSIVAGTTGTNNGNNVEAVRWTPSGGIVGLGLLPGGTNSLANGMGADGTVIVGYTTNNGSTNRMLKKPIGGSDFY